MVAQVVTVPWDSLQDGPPNSAANPGKLAKDAARAIGGFLGDFAGWLFRGGPIGAISRSIANRIRQQSGLPPIPYGGDVFGGCGYCVDYTFEWRSVSNFPPYTASDWVTAGGKGPFTGIRVVSYESPPGTPRVNAFVATACPNVPEPPAAYYMATGFIALPGQYRWEVRGVRRADGGQDFCPPTQGYDPETYDPPGPNYRIPDFPIPDGSGTNIYVPVAIPIVNLDGSITVDIGGIDITFDLGGVNITPPGVSGPSVDLSEVLDAIDGVSGQVGDVSGQVSGVGDSVNNLSDRLAPPGESEGGEYVDEVRPEEEAEVDATGVAFVDIIITQLPNSSKIQSGEGSPNVIYAGWFEWTIDGRPLPRTPINYQESRFVNPGNATGYAYALTNGARGYAVQFRR